MFTKIRYVKNEEINKQKWDFCIESSTNRIVFAFSWYLDNLCPDWDALIFNDYSAVMPIIHGKKYTLNYIYNPYFSSRLGVFSKTEHTEVLFSNFLNSVLKKYKLISIKFNTDKLYEVRNYELTRNVNYILPLNRKYDELMQNFSKNHKQNIKKALSSEIVIKREKNIRDLVCLKQDMMSHVSGQKPIHFERLYNTLHAASEFAEIILYNAYTPNNDICASAAFLISGNRAIKYSATTLDGKKLRGGYAIVNRFIKDFAGNNILLDFAGSNIKGIADFNAGFGSIKKVYPCYTRRKFPLTLFPGFKTSQT